MGKHAVGDTPFGQLAVEDSIEDSSLDYTIGDSQQLAAVIDPVTRAKDVADALLKARRLTSDNYWPFVDGYVMGWEAREVL
jgi:hypothetical protein